MLTLFCRSKKKDVASYLSISSVTEDKTKHNLYVFLQKKHYLVIVRDNLSE